MKIEIVEKLKKLNIYSLQPYLLDAGSKDTITLKFEQPYFLVRSHNFHDEAQINKNLRKKAIIAYMRINGIHHYIYYLKTDELQNKLYTMVYENQSYELIETLKLRNTDNLYILHKNLPTTPTPTSTTSQSDEHDDLPQLPTTTNSTDIIPNLFNPEKSHDKPTLYLYKALLPYINDYKQFQTLCYLLHILKASGTLAVHGNVAHISHGDLTTLLPPYLKRGKRKHRKRRTKLNKCFDYFLQNIEPYTVDGIYECENILEISLNDDFLARLCNPPYLEVNLDFVGEFNKNNYQFLIYFIQYLFQVNPKKTFLLKISTQELLKKTGILKPTTHSTIATIVARVNNYFNILFKYHITPRPYTISAKDITNNSILKIELKRFQISRDFNPIIGAGMVNDL